MAGQGRVWITRAQPGADETAARVAALGRAPLVAPLLTLRPIPQPQPDLEGVDALAFTSANGVRAFADLSGRRDLLVFAVGEATAAAAAAAGFRVAAQGRGGVAVLADLIRAQGPEVGLVLHPGAREPAGDLVGDLARGGVKARSLPVYEAVEADALPGEARDALSAGQMEAVLLHSPRAGRVLARLGGGIGEAGGFSRAAAIGLSEACVAPLRRLGFVAVKVAERPCEAALLRRLDPPGPGSPPLAPT